jgi:hypothetical protein
VKHFTHFQFEPISLEQFRARFPDFSQADAEELFDYWLIDFYYEAMRFYKAKYDQHHHKLAKSFRQFYKLSDEEWRKEEWEQYAAEYELPEHSYLSNQEIERADEINDRLHHKRFGVSNKSSSLVSGATLLTRRMRLGAPPEQAIWEIWFDALINNSPQTRASLKWIKYPGYLATDHWKKVRDAMLMSYHARCQARACLYDGESWYGDEADIHVHHLTYENKGNERYRDLTLLCRAHHDLWHENQKAGRPQTVEFIWP